MSYTQRVNNSDESIQSRRGTALYVATVSDDRDEFRRVTSAEYWSHSERNEIMERRSYTDNFGGTMREN